MHQSMPDEFYSLLFVASFAATLITGRALAVYHILWRPSYDRKHTQRARYGFAMCGFLVSTVYFAILLWRYTPDEIRTGINELATPFAIVSWLVIGINVVCLVMSVVFAVHAYRRPTYFARIDLLTRLAIPTDDMRFIRSR